MAEAVTKRQAVAREDEAGAEAYSLVDIGPEHVDGIAELARHTYGGHDWITTECDKWRDRDTYIALGLEDGAGFLAALYVLRAVRSDRLGSLEALRVHPDHRGRQLAHRIHREMIARARSRRAEMGIDRVSYTCYDENYASIKVATTGGLKVVYSFPYMMETNYASNGAEAFTSRTGPGALLTFFKDCASALESVAVLRSETIVESTSAEDVHDALKLLFKEEGERAMLHQSWKPFYITLDTIKGLMSNHRTFIGREESTGEVTSVSMASFRPEHGGSICTLGIYVKPSDSPGMAGCSVLRHLVEVWGPLCKDVSSVYTSYPLCSFETLKKFDIIRRPTPQKELVFCMDL